MGRHSVPPARPALSVLVIVADGRHPSVPVTTTPGEVLVTHALSLPAALATLGADSFDCVLVEVGSADPATIVDVLRAVRARAGDAALVVTHGDADGTPLDGLADLVVDPYAGPSEWPAVLQHAAENARLRIRLSELERSITHLSGIVDTVADAVFAIDIDGRITSWNKGAARLYGYPAAEVVGRDVAVLHPPGSDERRQLLSLLDDSGYLRELDTVRRAPDGRLAEVTIDATVQRDETGEATGVVVLARDINGRRELHAELDRQTMRDALTGLPKRSYLTYRITQALAEGRRRRKPVAVLIVDLDQFGAVGDMHGHLIGDKVLIETANRLSRLARPGSTVARVGGDEFVLVCPNTDVTEASALAERVIDVIAEPIAVEHRMLRLGASVGIAVSPPLTGGADALLRHADIAVHEAKARGRSRSQVFDTSFARQVGELRRMGTELRAALARDELEVHYQPVVDLHSDELVGVEALVRWHRPGVGAVSPATFIPLAETQGFIAELDRWVLARACTDIAAALDSGRLPGHARIAVNLSARSLDDASLAATVADALRRSGLPPESLVLEVTETAVLQNRSAARTSLEGLRRLGVGVFLDDFGTGYSSLSFLRELPVTGVKIDRSFVRDALDRPEDLAITEAIVRLARGLGLETVGEGVETAEQRELLRRLGCVSAQGFWWSPAVPLAELDVQHTGAHLHRPVQASRPAAIPTRTVEATRSSATCCLRGGLEAGQGWLVVSNDERRAVLARSLGSLYGAAVARGQLVELNAYETIHTVTGPDGRFDEERFDRVLADALRRLARVANDVGIHAELEDADGSLLGPSVSGDLHRRLRAHAAVVLERPVECADHGAPHPLALPGFTAS